MKKLVLLILAAAVTLIAAITYFTGVSPLGLPNAIATATGMGAKLACSGRYISGLSERQNIADLASYSPIYESLTITYDDSSKTASAALFGLKQTRARYRSGLGCTLEIGDTSLLDAISVSPLPPRSDPWPLGSLVATLSDPLQSRAEEIMKRDNAAGLQTRALLVVGDGKILAEAYAPGFSPQTPLLGWSMGKSLLSIMLGHLAHHGRLDAQETDLFASWREDERADISLQNLLQMSSGLAFEEVYAPGSEATRMLFTAYNASALAEASPLLHPPGAHFAYSSGTTNLLADLFVTRAGGTQAAVDILYRDIFIPLGMQHAFLEPDPSGVFVASSYAYLSARDWARLGQLMLNGGVLNNQRIISRDWVEQAREPNTSSNDRRYGYQFWLNDGGAQPRWPELPSDSFAMLGNRMQVVMVVPSHHAVLVRLGWSPGAYPTAERFAELLRAM